MIGSDGRSCGTWFKKGEFEQVSLPPLVFATKRGRYDLEGRRAMSRRITATQL